MTEQEKIQNAIKSIKYRIETAKQIVGKNGFEDMELAIHALEKQIPKKPTLVKRADGIISFYPCPNCSTSENYVSVYPKQKYCVYCGQKLDWSEGE